MTEEAGEKARADLPPYVPYKTFKSFIDGLRANGVPDQIDRSAMPTMSGATQGQVLSALRYLGLTRTNNTPTEELAGLVAAEGDERKALMQDILKRHYKFIFESSTFSPQKATAGQLTSAFVSTGAQGETITKCISFFMLAAKDCALPLSPYFKHVRGTRGPGSRPRRAAPSLKRPQSGEAEGEEEEDALAPAAPRSRFEILMEKFPAFDPAWSADVQAKWFEAFERLQTIKETPA